jgi:protein SCO1/2
MRLSTKLPIIALALTATSLAAPRVARAEQPAQNRETANPANPAKRPRGSTIDVKLPQIKLVRHDGQTVALTDELDDGRPTVVNFIFTSCTTICPVMSQIFSQLQARLGTDRDSVHMVSISIDPEQDTPARLREYAKRFHAGPQWQFYTGTAEASLAAQRAFNSLRGDKMAHTPVTFLRAGPGSRWVRVDGFVPSDELLAELRQQLALR